MKLLKAIYRLYKFYLILKDFEVSATNGLIGDNKARFTVEFKRKLG